MEYSIVFLFVRRVWLVFVSVQNKIQSFVMNRETFFGVFSIITFNDKLSIISLKELVSQTNAPFGNYCVYFKSKNSIKQRKVSSVKHCKHNYRILIDFDIKYIFLNPILHFKQTFIRSTVTQELLDGFSKLKKIFVKKQVIYDTTTIFFKKFITFSVKALKVYFHFFLSFPNRSSFNS